MSAQRLEAREGVNGNHPDGRNPAPTAFNPNAIRDLKGEALKAALLRPENFAMRSQDALLGVEFSSLQPHVEKATTGPYDTETLFGKPVTDFLSDPTRVTIIMCGRNEAEDGSLGATFKYIQRSTGVDNAIYFDGNSTDNSLQVAHEHGIRAVSRDEVLHDKMDLDQFSRILALPRKAFETQERIADAPPLRKGMEVLVSQITMLESFLQGKASQYLMYLDTDLQSIPTGLVGRAFRNLENPQDEKIYLPAQLLAAAIVDLNMMRGVEDPRAIAVFTGSGNRNNEAIHAMYVRREVDAKNPFLSDQQRAIARALSVAPGLVVHPLTGELLVDTQTELSTMGATGQGVETTRMISLAWRMAEMYGTSDSEALATLPPVIGNVRRGQQERIDKPQNDMKEWAMITGTLQVIEKVIGDYAIQTGKTDRDFSLDDYTKINRWLSQITEISILDNGRQTRMVLTTPMERVIPPVDLLHPEGIIKL